MTLQCVVFLFAWLVEQTYFKELTDDDIRARMFLEQQHQLEQDMAHLDLLDNGLDDAPTIIDEYGTRWSPVVRSYQI